MPDPDNLQSWLTRLSHLHRDMSRGNGGAPHKPVLILTLLDAVSLGLATDNLFQVTAELVALFRTNWQALVPPGIWHEKMGMPFRYLIYDGFWHLVRSQAASVSYGPQGHFRSPCHEVEGIGEVGS